MNEITREYAIPLPMFEQAFRAFQRRFVYPRNYGITVLLIGVICIYVNAALQDSTNTLSYILIFMSAAVICITWYNTHKIRTTLMDSVRELADDRYRLTVTDTGLLLRTLLPEASEAEAPGTDTVIVPAKPEAASDEPDSNGFNPVFGENAAAEIPPSEFLFTQNLRVQEYAAFYNLYLEKGMFYVIPKDCYTAQELQSLNALFTEKLGKRFRAAK